MSARPTAARALAKAAASPSVLDLLSRDHREIERLFGRVARAKTADSRAGAFRVLQDALTSHARLEEAIVYPALRTTSVPALLVAASRAYAEHRETRILLAELAGIAPSSGRFASKLAALEDMVREHVREEEFEIFHLAKRALGLPRLRVLGGRLESCRAPSDERVARWEA